MMPATCVPWPYLSVAVVASGCTTAEPMTRERLSVVGDAEVGQVAGDAGVDHRDTHAARRWRGTLFQRCGVWIDAL